MRHNLAALSIFVSCLVNLYPSSCYHAVALKVLAFFMVTSGIIWDCLKIFFSRQGEAG